MIDLREQKIQEELDRLTSDLTEVVASHGERYPDSDDFIAITAAAFGGLLANLVVAFKGVEQARAGEMMRVSKFLVGACDDVVKAYEDGTISVQ